MSLLELDTQLQVSLVFKVRCMHERLHAELARRHLSDLCRMEEVPVWAPPGHKRKGTPMHAVTAYPWQSAPLDMLRIPWLGSQLDSLCAMWSSRAPTLLFWLAILPCGSAVVDSFTELGLALVGFFQGRPDHVCTQVGILEVGHARHAPVTRCCG